MFIDLLNSYNYIMVNMDAIRIFGLNTAVYTAELLNIYKKAKMKNKLIEDVNGKHYFKIDRKFIATRVPELTSDEQLKCDLKLLSINVIEKYNNEPDTIRFDVELYASLIASEDVKLVDKVVEKVNVDTPSGYKTARRDVVIRRLKESIICSNEELLFALRDWIDTIFQSGKGLTKKQIELFQNSLNQFSQGDLDVALKIVEIATIHSYVDCQWAINLYNGSTKKSVPAPASAARVTTQRVATKETISTKKIF